MTTTAVQTTEERAVEFIPFGAKDAIKLTASIVRNFIANPTKSGALPDDRQCIKFVMLCKAKRLNPFEGDAFLVGYDSQKEGPQFSLITAHQAFLKRAEANPEYDGMRSGVIVESKHAPDPDLVGAGEIRIIRRYDGKFVYEREGDFVFADETLLGGWAQVNFKDRSTPTLRRANLQTFDKGFGLWYNKENKPGMIVKCAEADALRSSFPTLLGGMYVEGEMQPLQIDAQTVAPITMPQAIGNAKRQAIDAPQTVAGDFSNYTAEPEPAPAKGTKGKKAKAAEADDADDSPETEQAELMPAEA